MQFCGDLWKKLLYRRAAEGDETVRFELWDRTMSIDKGRTAMGLFGALVISLTVVAVAMIWTWRIGQGSGRIYHALYHEHEALEGLRRIASAPAAAARRH